MHSVKPLVAAAHSGCPSGRTQVTCCALPGLLRACPSPGSRSRARYSWVHNAITHCDQRRGRTLVHWCQPEWTEEKFHTCMMGSCKNEPLLAMVTMASALLPYSNCCASMTTAHPCTMVKLLDVTCPHMFRSLHILARVEQVWLHLQSPKQKLHVPVEALPPQTPPTTLA